MSWLLHLAMVLHGKDVCCAKKKFSSNCDDCRFFHICVFCYLYSCQYRDILQLADTKTTKSIFLQMKLIWIAYQHTSAYETTFSKALGTEQDATGGGERKVGLFQFAGIFFHFYRLCKILLSDSSPCTIFLVGGRRGAGILYCQSPNLILYTIWLFGTGLKESLFLCFTQY